MSIAKSSQSHLREDQIPVDDLSIHVIRGGSQSSPALLFLHGWPQCADAFRPLMTKVADRFQVVAIDLPGIGRSTGRPPGRDKRTLAAVVHRLIRTLDLDRTILVGHDIGGMIVYAFLRTYPGGVNGAVIMNVAVPGVDPWEEIVRNPAIWHFGFHNVPELPERLVTGHVDTYFDFFFDTIAATPEAVTQAARRAYAAAYSTRQSLKAGFDWYRAFSEDAAYNAAHHGDAVDTPTLYLRGEKEHGFDLTRYVDGLRGSGLGNVSGQLISNAGHFSADEQPDELADIIASFTGKIS